MQMKKKKKPHLFETIPKPIIKFYPFIGAIIFLVFTYLAINTYNDYDFFGQTLSELGVGPSAIYFNIGIILTGLFMLPFYASMYSKSKTSKFSSATGVMSALSLIFVGIFTLDYLMLHLLVAFCFFILSALTITLYEVDRFLSGKVELLCINQILVSVIILSYIFVFNNPFMQKFSVFLIILWILMTNLENNFDNF